MKERVKTLITELELSSSAFADRIGVPRSSISHILSGRNKPSLELCQKILDAFPVVRTEWLVRGKGNMFDHQRNLFTSSPQGEHASASQGEQASSLHGQQASASHGEQASSPHGQPASTSHGEQASSPQGQPAPSPHEKLPDTGHSLAGLDEKEMAEQEKDRVSVYGEQHEGPARHERRHQKPGIQAEPDSAGLSPAAQTQAGQVRMRKINKVITLFDDGSFKEYQAITPSGSSEV